MSKIIFLDELEEPNPYENQVYDVNSLTIIGYWWRKNKNEFFLVFDIPKKDIPNETIPSPRVAITNSFIKSGDNLYAVSVKNVENIDLRNLAYIIPKNIRELIYNGLSTWSLSQKVNDKYLKLFKIKKPYSKRIELNSKKNFLERINYLQTMKNIYTDKLKSDNDDLFLDEKVDSDYEEILKDIDDELDDTIESYANFSSKQLKTPSEESRLRKKRSKRSKTKIRKINK